MLDGELSAFQGREKERLPMHELYEEAWKNPADHNSLATSED